MTSLQLSKQDDASKWPQHKSIMYCLEKFQATIISTDVGLGNLNSLAQYLEELGWHTKGNIGVVECCGEPNFYSAKDEIDKRGSGTIFLSEEELLREFFINPLLTDYSVVLLNEVHRRYILTDTLLALLKKVIRKRSSIRLLLITNSKEAVHISEYFNSNKQKAQKITVATLSIDDRKLDQKIYYLNEPCASYVAKSVETCIQINRQQASGSGDIIIYLADEDEILDAMEHLRNYIEAEHIGNLNYFKFTQTKNERQHIFFPRTEGKRNVIFTTRLYQNSVTQDRIKYVIDCGFMQLEWYQPQHNRSNKLIVPTCKITASLRAKWLNKYSAAKVFRLYTKDTFGKLPDRSTPEMRRLDLSSIVLYLKTLAVDNILRFDFPLPPPASNLLAALENLYALEALDDQGQLNHPLGYMMADAPFSPMLTRTLFNSVKLQCSDEILTIITMLHLEPIFIITNNNAADGHKQVAKRAFESSEGDLITLLNVYTSFIENGLRKEFCHKYYLNYRNLMHAHTLREKLASTLLRQYGIKQISCKGNIERILQCIVSGCFLNVAYLHPSGCYRNLRSELELYIDNDSVFRSLSQQKYLIYCQSYEKSSRTFISHLTAIKKEWLYEHPSHYYEEKAQC